MAPVLGSSSSLIMPPRWFPPYHLGWNAEGHDVVRHILGNHTTSPHDRPRSNSQILQNNCSGAYLASCSDVDIPGDVHTRRQRTEIVDNTIMSDGAIQIHMHMIPQPYLIGEDGACSNNYSSAQ